MKKNKAESSTTKTNGSIKLEPQEAFMLGGLLAEQKALVAQQQALDQKLLAFLNDCARSKGIKIDEVELNTNTMEWVPKARRLIVQ